MPPERRNRSRRFRELSRHLRQNQNWVESILWVKLRNGRLKAFKFRRQHPIGNYIVDFYCAEARVVLELDGATHIGREIEDATRQEWLEKQGLLVIRCPNHEIDRGIDELLELIWKHCLERKEQSSDSANR